VDADLYEHLPTPCFLQCLLRRQWNFVVTFVIKLPWGVCVVVWTFQRIGAQTSSEQFFSSDDRSLSWLARNGPDQKNHATHRCAWHRLIWLYARLLQRGFHKFLILSFCSSIVLDVFKWQWCSALILIFKSMATLRTPCIPRRLSNLQQFVKPFVLLLMRQIVPPSCSYCFERGWWYSCRKCGFDVERMEFSKCVLPKCQQRDQSSDALPCMLS